MTFCFSSFGFCCRRYLCSRFAKKRIPTKASQRISFIKKWGICVCNRIIRCKCTKVSFFVMEKVSFIVIFMNIFNYVMNSQHRVISHGAVNS